MCMRAPGWRSCSLRPGTPHLPPPQVESAADIAGASKLVFPGVGSFGPMVDILRQRGLTQALTDYIQVRTSAGLGCV